MKHDLDRRQLSARFDRALTFAAQLHARPVRGRPVASRTLRTSLR